jgi:poly [ADP-ribose] polymerase
MPPRKAKAAAVPPLEGCSIALSGTFPGQTQSALENDFINALGATLSKTVTSSTTHLVTTDVDFVKPSTKVKQAQSHGLHIVSLAWLEYVFLPSQEIIYADSITEAA